MNNYLDYINVGINTLLALIGVIIAVLQYKNDKRESKRKQEAALLEEKNIRLIKDIAVQTKSVNKFDEIRDCKEKIGPYLNNLGNFPELFPLSQELAVCYNELLSEIEPLYKQLVINESSFSVSYGYGRYIDAFREFLVSKKDCKEFASMIYALSEINVSGEGIDEQELQKNREIFAKIYNKFVIQFQKLCDNVDKVVVLVEEIRIKYESYVDGANTSTEKNGQTE